MRTTDQKYYDWCGARRKRHQVNITKSEWIEMWNESGYWDLRGRESDQYSMYRLDRTKPFSVDNIEIKQNKYKGKC